MSPANGFGPAVWAADFAAYPDALRALMGPMEEVPLTDDDMATLSGAGRGISDVTQEVLAAVLPRFAGGAHLRLGLCSFKTGPAPMLPVHTVAQAVTTLCMHNRRVADIAARMRAEEREGILYLRPWREIPRWCEFRVFIRGRQVVGVTQYHLDRHYPEILRAAERIRHDIATLVGTLAPLLHVDDIVADVAVDPAGRGRAGLIELNPFLRRTGAGLFRWTDPFDGSFRVL